MWGYFMGREYAHRRYGPNRHSLRANRTFANSWYAINENRYWYADQASIFDWEHIPSGFLHDIRDNNTYNRDSSLLEHNLIGQDRDSISGYSINTIFNNQNSNTTSASQLIENLRWLLPPGIGNTIANYDTLKVRYGY